MNTIFRLFGIPKHRQVAGALGAMAIAWLTSIGSVGARPDPNPSLPTEYESPFSDRCQRAFNTYYLEAEWFMNHPGIDVDHPQFRFHYDRLFDSWFIAELECGVDIDHTGHLGY